MILKRKLENSPKKIKIILKFYLIFILSYVILTQFEAYLVKPVSYLTYLFVNFFVKAKLINNTIYLNNITVEIIKPCTGTFLLAAFLSLTLTLSKNLKDFLFGLFLTFLSFFVNILRIALFCILANIYPNNYKMIHEAIGYLVLISLSLILVYLYLSSLNYNS